MTLSSPNRTTSVPTQSIVANAGVEDQADYLREELARFRHDLDQVPQNYLSLDAAGRQAAYERLSQAAQQAAQIAESAVRSLDELARSTQRDPLTDTPNRTLMLDRMGNALMMARRRAARMAVMYLDLDHFKTVNDTRGHACGDEVLKVVARSLESAVRDSDTVSRFGGDEFVVLLSEISQPADAGVVARKMLDMLARSNELPSTIDGVRASIGISLFPEDGDDVPALLERADQAMYCAKKVAGSSVRFHSHPADAAQGGDGDSDELLNAERLRSMREANDRLVLSVMAGEPPTAEDAAKHGRRVRFLAMVAHELRHPLAPIRTAANLIRQTGDDEALLERMHSVIDNQVTQMARLVDDLLDDSRLGSGRFRMDQAVVDIAEVLQLVSRTWQPAIALKRQTLSLRVPVSGLSVHGDADRLAQVFINLLDNASRYTPAGGHIRVIARRVDDTIAVRVSDDGMGMPDDTRDCIFDLFARGPDAMAVHKGGLGIGLAVARELVEAHDGKITAHSAGEGQGSAFDVTLPWWPEADADTEG